MRYSLRLAGAAAAALMLASAAQAETPTRLGGADLDGIHMGARKPATTVTVTQGRAQQVKIVEGKTKIILRIGKRGKITKKIRAPRGTTVRFSQSSSRD